MDRLIWGGGILKRIYIPRTIFSMSEVGTGLVNLFLAMIPLAIIMLIMGHPFRLALLFLPVSILVIAMFHPGRGFVVFHLGFIFCRRERNVQNPPHGLVLSYSNYLSIEYYASKISVVYQS